MPSPLDGQVGAAGPRERINEYGTGTVPYGTVLYQTFIPYRTVRYHSTAVPYRTDAVVATTLCFTALFAAHWLTP